MAKTIVKCSKYTSIILDVMMVDKSKIKLKWLPMIYTTNDYLTMVRELERDLGVNSYKIYNVLCERCEQGTIFVKISHECIANILNTSREYVSKGMKLLLNYDKCPIVQVKPGLYAVNPTYIWKLDRVDREIYLAVIREHGYLNLYNALEAAKKAKILKTTISHDEVEFSNDFFRIMEP